MKNNDMAEFAKERAKLYGIKEKRKTFFLYRVIGLFILYFKVVILGKKEVEGYRYREVGNLPLVGLNYFKGYEIVNSKTNKVLYRKIKDWGYISGLYDPNRYKVVSKYFSSNAL